MKDNNNSGGESQQTGVIYKITNTLNGKKYVGQTRQKLNSRIYGHKSNKGKSAIDVAIRKYGWENFSVEVLETCPIEQLNEREMFWIAALNSKVPNGYNLTGGGGGLVGCTQETRYKMSLAKKGKKRKHHSLETRAKMSVKAKGRPSSNKGKHLSEKTRAKMSAAHKGKSRKPHSEETRSKISASKKGQKHSSETCAKIAAGVKAAWARKKAIENGGDK